MKNWVIVVALVAFISSCSHVPPAVVDTTGRISTDCLAPEVRDVATPLLDDVASALLSGGNWKDAVNSIAVRIKTNGWEAVWCAVEYLKGDAKIKLFASAKMDTNTASRQHLLYNRAEAWLADHK